MKHLEKHLRHYPELWSFDSRSVRKALYIGLVMAWLPTMGIQAPLAILMAFLTRSNLTVMFATQFVTNPLTAGPAYYLTYQVGDFVLALWPGYHPTASLDEHIEGGMEADDPSTQRGGIPEGRRAQSKPSFSPRFSKGS